MTERAKLDKMLKVMHEKAYLEKSNGETVELGVVIFEVKGPIERRNSLLQI